MDKTDQEKSNGTETCNDQDVIIDISVIELKWLKKKNEKEQTESDAKSYPEKSIQGIIKWIGSV